MRSAPGRFPFWLHLMSNAYWEALDFELPALPPAAAVPAGSAGSTRRESLPRTSWIPPRRRRCAGTQYRVMPRSVAVLFARTDDRSRPAIELEPK